MIAIDYKLSQCYQHDDNVSICVVPQLSQPSLHILVGQVLGDVVDQQGTNCSPVVPAQKEGFNTIQVSTTTSRFDHECVKCEIMIRKVESFELTQK